MKSVSKILIVIGCFAILYAIFMDTTVSSGYGRIHNLGLQADRQLFLILGCFMAFAGVVLIAVLKLKQTPDQEAAEVAARRAVISTAKQAAVSAAQQLTESTAVRKSGRLLSTIRLNPRKAISDNLAGRLAIAGFVAICAVPVSSILLFWWVLPIVALLYSIADRPAIDVMRSLLHVNLACTLLIALLFTLIMLEMEGWRSEAIASDSPIGVAIHFVPTAIALIGTGISLVCLYYLRRKPASPELGGHQI
ncbi:hypothetical protein B9Z47_17735 [Limnohabitans sp. 2KL-1]|uniref:hypothetical protein n=1 Tax=Limnohabitans sp. 2KL-1 TaxID=1100699 RepID=UPI000D3A56D4|nr:hypothetical protein [Limnohabitans sp. 2KL-1]PUE44715.1 hypothetical protein B9Z47_17735 [Limnohabitans sp. 2KL-1]